MSSFVHSPGLTSLTSDFCSSNSIACETKLFQKVFGDFFKGFKKSGHPVDGCPVERTFQMFLAIAEFEGSLGSVKVQHLQ